MKIFQLNKFITDEFACLKGLIAFNQAQYHATTNYLLSRQMLTGDEMNGIIVSYISRPDYSWRSPRDQFLIKSETVLHFFNEKVWTMCKEDPSNVELLQSIETTFLGVLNTLFNTVGRNRLINKWLNYQAGLDAEYIDTTFYEM